MKNKRPTRDTSRQQAAQNAPFDAAASAKERNLAQITVLDNHWYDRTETQNALHLGERQLRLWVQMGRIRTKINPANTRQRLYKAEDVEKLRQEGPTKAPRSETAENVPVRAAKAPKPKPNQEERALDTVAIVGNQAIGYKGAIEAIALQSTRQIEILVAQMDRQLSQSEQRFEAFVTLMLQHQKAEADANRDRLKAEREDDRERWEMDRQDRLERRKSRLTIVPPPQNAKARKAHA